MGRIDNMVVLGRAHREILQAAEMTPASAVILMCRTSSTRTRDSLLLALLKIFRARRRGSDVPRHDQHCPRCAAEHAIADRAFTKSPPPSAAVRSKNDKVSLSRICMQNDNPSGIAVLLHDPNGHAVPLCAFPHGGQQFEPLGRAPRKRHIRRHRVKNVESRFTRTSNAQCAVERVTACFRQIDCANDFSDSRHVSLAFWRLVRRPALRQVSTAVRHWQEMSP